MRPQHGGRGCGTKTDLSGMQGADGFSLKTKAGSFPLQPGRSETLAVPYSTVLNCAVSVDCSSGESCRKYSGSLPSSPILSPDSWLLFAQGTAPTAFRRSPSAAVPEWP